MRRLGLTVPSITPYLSPIRCRWTATMCSMLVHWDTMTLHITREEIPSGYKRMYWNFAATLKISQTGADLECKWMKNWVWGDCETLMFYLFWSLFCLIAFSSEIIAETWKFGVEELVHLLLNVIQGNLKLCITSCPAKHGKKFSHQACCIFTLDSWQRWNLIYNSWK